MDKRNRGWFLCRVFALCPFVLAVGLLTVCKVWMRPQPFTFYLVYAGVWAVMLLPLVLAAFRLPKWRMAYFAFLYICMTTVAVLPHPATPLIRDLARIERGMTMDEARAVLSPHIARGDLELMSGITPIGRDGNGALVYYSRTITSISSVSLDFRNGRAQSTGISWEE